MTDENKDLEQAVIEAAIQWQDQGNGASQRLSDAVSALLSARVRTQIVEHGMSDEQFLIAMDLLVKIFDGRQDACVHLTPDDTRRLLKLAKRRP